MTSIGSVTNLISIEINYNDNKQTKHIKVRHIDKIVLSIFAAFAAAGKWVVLRGEEGTNFKLEMLNIKPFPFFHCC